MVILSFLHIFALSTLLYYNAVHLGMRFSDFCGLTSFQSSSMIQVSTLQAFLTHPIDSHRKAGIVARNRAEPSSQNLMEFGLPRVCRVWGRTGPVGVSEWFYTQRKTILKENKGTRVTASDHHPSIHPSIRASNYPFHKCLLAPTASQACTRYLG